MTTFTDLAPALKHTHDDTPSVVNGHSWIDPEDGTRWIAWWCASCGDELHREEVTA